VAPGLLGKVLIRKWRGREIAALITEVEAYRGVDDPASHAARGRTARNEVMFGRSGMSYVYFVYGMHHCLNVVTEPQGRAGAVLIRGVMLIDGKKVHGPGRVCSTLRLTRAHSGREMLRPGENLELVDVGIRVPKDAIAQTPRIGISKGGDLPWRWEWILT
jgi:DNA-3-methyladenine glycosylase